MVEYLVEENARARLPRIGEERGGRRAFDHLSCFHEEDFGGELAGKAHLVGHHDHRHAASGEAAHDLARVADSLVALGNLAVDLGDALESIDINPIVSRPGKKPVALDAVIVLRGKE